MIYGAPRTKKNSKRQIVTRTMRHLTLPSEAHERWFNTAMSQAPGIVLGLRACGFELPITAPVRIEAVFYRVALVGDLLGYEEALGDWLQTATATSSGGTRNNGAGIIRDDKQIVRWGDSRLDKDAANPRIEVEVTIL